MRVRLLCAIITLSLFSLISGGRVSAQDPRPQEGPRPIATLTDVYCTGFVSDVKPNDELMVVGAEKENLRFNFGQGDIVFINKGREFGIQAGAFYTVLRPMGEMKHPFKKDKKLGYFSQELGMLRIVEVQSKTSTAEITMSCDSIGLGDLLRPYETYNAPMSKQATPLARYSEGVGGLEGQIVLSRGFHEYLSARQIVFLDLGSEQGVNSGDYFTIFRKIGKSEGPVAYKDDKVTKQQDAGFESNRYHGGRQSIDNPGMAHEDVLKNRPELPRKNLGELVVLKVEKNTCVAIITRTIEEVNIGDHIERIPAQP